jgi:hypothetical protein
MQEGHALAAGDQPFGCDAPQVTWRGRGDERVPGHKAGREVLLGIYHSKFPLQFQHKRGRVRQNVVVTHEARG